MLFRHHFFDSPIWVIVYVTLKNYFRTVSTRIIIFEDNDRLRESLAFMLASYETYDVVAHYADCNDAANAIAMYEPDVVLMDIDMPGKTGIEGVRVVKETLPKTAVIMYTVFEDDERLFQALCAGANGYLLKKTPPDKLFEAINDVMAGGAPMSPSVARKVIATFQTARSLQSYSLSQREMEVLQLLTKGYSAKVIGDHLFIAGETVRSHLKNIYQKLHVNCGKEAIAKALGEQIV